MPTTLRRMHNGVYVWWERDADIDLSHVGPLPDFGHEDCWHRTYRLTCKQYEYLLRRSDGKCEICRLPGHENVSGRLYIDHDPKLGIWAVRGLLCRTCNGNERFPWAASKRYHANAWYLGVLAEAGVPVRGRRQPRVGTTVLDHADRIWQRTAEGWIRRYGRSQDGPFTWAEMVYRYGPHNLHVIGRAA